MLAPLRSSSSVTCFLLGWGEAIAQCWKTAETFKISPKHENKPQTDQLLFEPVQVNTFDENATLIWPVITAAEPPVKELLFFWDLNGSDQSSVAGLRVLEADDLQSQRLLHFGQVCLPCCLQQRVTFKLI